MKTAGDRACRKERFVGSIGGGSYIRQIFRLEKGFFNGCDAS